MYATFSRQSKLKMKKNCNCLLFYCELGNQKKKKIFKKIIIVQLTSNFFFRESFYSL